MKLFRIVAVAIGIGLAAFLIKEVGLGQIRDSLGLLGWGYGVVLSYPITWMVLNAQGWRSALPSPVSLSYITCVRIAGETFNSLLPSGYVGGEPLKAKFLSRRMPMSDAASSVLIAKAGQSVALVGFVVLGLVLGGRGHPSALKDPKTLAALSALTIGIGSFVWLLAKRSFSRLGRRMFRLTKIGWITKHLDKLSALDNSLGAFYQQGPLRFLVCVLWHAAGWVAGALEVAIIFHMIGHSVSIRQAWFIGAWAQLAAVIGLMVPAGVGLYEGGHYLAASMLGLDPALGLSVSLIRRVREVFWDGIGIFFLLVVVSREPRRID